MSDFANDAGVWSRQEPTGRVPRLFAGALRRRWLLVAGLAILGFAAGAGYSRLVWPTYFSQALVTLNLARAERLRAESNAVVIDKISGDLLVTHQSAIAAEPLLRRVVTTLGPEPFERRGWRETVLERFDLASPPTTADPAERTDKALAVLQDGLVVSRLGDSYVISIGYKWSDAGNAARIANAVADAYLQDQRRIERGYGGQRIAWLQSNLERARGQLAAVSEEIVRYQGENGIVMVDDKPVDDGEMKTAATTLNDAELRLVQAQATLSGLETALAQNTPLAANNDVIDLPVLKGLREKYQEALTLRNAIVARVGPAHGAAIVASNDVDGIARQITAEVQRAAAGYRSDIGIAREMRDGAMKNLTALFSASQESRRKLLALMDLRARQGAQKALVDDLSGKLARARANLDFPIRELELTQRAVPLEVKLAPKTSRLAIAGTAGGILLSFALIGAGFFMNGRVRTRRQVEAALGLPCFGYVPHFAQDPVDIRPVRMTFTRDLLIAAPFGLFAETLRAAYLKHQANSDERSVVIGVVAASGGEGATTVAANLALAVAASGTRCLLVDADSRTAGLSQKSNWPREGSNVDDVLTGRASLAEATVPAHDNLALLRGAGRTGSRSMLDGVPAASIVQAFATMRDEYAVVVVDLPPFGEVVDAAVLAPVIDSFVLIVDGQAARASSLQKAVAGCRQVAEKFSGAIINKVDIGELELHGESIAGYYAGGYLANER